MESTTQITVFNLYLHVTLALSLTLCGPNNVLEVEFGKSNNTFPCEGLQSNESVTWSLTHPDIPGQQFEIGVCQPLSTSGETCTFVSRDVFYLQRTFDTSSDLYVNASVPSTRDRLPKGVKVTCASMQNSETCLIDLVHPAQGVACSVQFRSGTWSLIGQCNISTAYSNHSRYSCQWFQTQNTPAKTIFLTTTNITYNTSSTSGNITGFCILNVSLPLDNGIYAVTVGITPGNKNFTSTFIGNNTIYKPSFLPNITCADNIGQYAQEGAELMCICTVPSLGEPPGRLVFHWHTNEVIYGNYSEKGVLLIQNISRLDNRRVIKCVLEWATRNDDLYVNYTIAVAYPPQTPGITYRAQQYPFMEGDTCTLFCGFPNGADRGNPPAHLAWQSQQVTNILGSDSSNVSLTLHPLNKTHNGLNVVCDAVNNFTTVTNTRVSANVTIEVYYRPILTLSALPYIACLSNSTSWQCVLEDGQLIDINCTADGNPRPRTTFWRTAGFTLPSNQYENLHIASANHSLHTGIYFCNATSEGNGNDSRLPLSSENELHIIVKYKAELINMSLNFVFGNVTVDEHKHLTIGCQANGMPTPMLLLYKGNTSSQLLQRIPGGILSISEEKSVISYSINSLHCENSSVYTCIARNEVENSSIEATQQLYVKCKPRYAGGDSPVLIYNEHPLSLKLKLVAYPVPDVYNVTFLGPSPNWNSSDGTVTENIFHLTCFAPETLYDIHCEITIGNITSKEQEGYYKLEVSNGYGTEIILYEIKVPDAGKQRSTTSFAAAIGGGVSAAIAIIAIIIVICFVLQRRKKEKSNEQKSLRRKDTVERSLTGRKQNDDGPLIINDLYASAGTHGGTTKPLSTNPQRDFTEYENAAFVKDNTEDASQVIVYPKEHQMHEDGLVYTTIQFSDIQAKRDELPPKREPTEYAKIDFVRTHNQN